MIDYDLTIIDQDKKDLMDKKYMFTDKEKNELINFAELMESFNPRQKKAMSTERLARFVVKIQKVIRGFLARRYCETLRNKEIVDLKDDLKKIGKDKPGSSSKSPRKTGQKVKPTKEQRAAELKKKKEKIAKDQRLGKRNAMQTEKRLDSMVRNPRDARDRERARRSKEDLENYIKNNIIESLIERAHAYGESLEVCKGIQKKFEMRPVTKFIYPLLQQFQMTATGVQPKSLSTLNSLGQLMYMNRQNLLMQYDISTNKML